MNSLGFASSALWRLSIALGFCVIAVLAVGVVEGGPSAAPIVASSPNNEPVTSDLVVLELESTYAVARWDIQHRGKTLAAQMQDARRWRGQIPAGAKIYIHAEPEDPLASDAVGLQWRCDERSGILWSYGNISSEIETGP